MNLRRIVLLAMICIVLCALSSCGIPKPPGEEKISKDLPSEVTTMIIENPFDLANMDVNEMEIGSLSIEKRQTNEKEDFVYCVVELENEYYQFTKYLKINYNYYDKGGWILDSYSEYKDMDWKLLGCPFDAKEIALVFNYPQVEFKESSFDSENGAASFSFSVEDVHKNGVYTGVAEIDCQFDGKKWIYVEITENIHFIWDIVGTWKYSKVETTSYDSVVNEIVLIVQAFDQTSGAMDGTWYMNSEFSLLQSHAEDMISLDNAERVKVGMDKIKSLIELWENPDQRGMHSYVRFYPDYVEATYTSPSMSHFGPVHLERTDSSDTIQIPSDSNLESTDAENAATWNGLIEQYFTIMETNDQDAIMAHMLEAGPYGDDVYITGEHLQQYEVVKTEHSNEFYMSNYDELLEEIELMKYELEGNELKSDFNLDPEDIASLYVQAEFSNYEIGVVEYRFWFVKDSGIWVLFYVDEAL